MNIDGDPTFAADGDEAMPDDAGIGGAGGPDETGGAVYPAATGARWESAKCSIDTKVADWIPVVACGEGPCFAPVDEYTALLRAEG